MSPQLLEWQPVGDNYLQVHNIALNCHYGLLHCVEPFVEPKSSQALLLHAGLYPPLHTWLTSKQSVQVSTDVYQALERSGF